MLQKEIAAKIHASEIRADIDYPKMSSKIWEHVISEQERAFLAGIDFSNRCMQHKKTQNSMKRTICKHCNPNRETIIGVETNCSECGTELIHILNEKIMSGGYFDYNQYRINDIADSIERVLNRQGKEKPKDELYGDNDEKYYYTYPKIVQEKMREAVKQLKIAAVYAQRVDWFLSGDDGEESFIERLAEDLNAL